jgi:hypothetical protein
MVEYYSIRRVNPFLGVTQVVRTADGRAISTNGVVWEIHLRAQMPAAWGSLSQQQGEPAYCRYGMWRPESGLSRVSRSSQDQEDWQDRAQVLVDIVESSLERLPFAMQDTCELWLQDQQQRPLALLATRSPDEPEPRPLPKYWQGALGREGIASQKRYPDSQLLEEQVRQRAGSNIRREWYTRQQQMVIDSRGNEYEAGYLPAYLLSLDWPEETEARLAGEYIQWIAPSLLTLQTLDTPERQYLEKVLYRQALSIEYHWRLFPSIIDETMVKASRVQARIQEA